MDRSRPRAAAGLALSTVLLLAVCPGSVSAAEATVRVRSADGAVERVKLERYVAAAVNGEMPTGWPAEALRAQAVVSRSYALHHLRTHAADPFDVDGGTRGQVYAPKSIAPSALAAVAETRGEVLTHQGLPILAVFHSASGGRTASAAEVWGADRPYLASVVVPDEDDSPATYWRVGVSRPTLRRALDRLGLGVGTVLDIEVTKRTPSGRVAELYVQGQRGANRLSGRALREALGESLVKSTLFEVRRRSKRANGANEASGSNESPRRSGDDADFVLVGSGYGHGVGMSQWAARSMAKSGSNYDEILQLFYPGARLEVFAAKALRRFARGGELQAAPPVSANATSAEAP